jgi:hypothetical protein
MVRQRGLCSSVEKFYGITYTIVLYINLKPEKKEQLVELLGAKAGDLILFALGD